MCSKYIVTPTRRHMWNKCVHAHQKRKRKEKKLVDKEAKTGVMGFGDSPALLECCPFLETAPHSRPAAKHTKPIGEPSKHPYQGLG